MRKPRSTAAAGPTPLRCAVYTRKSSDEGLEQSFNSLHAQREACEAYIKSQAHEGWTALATPYDDGGFSGGSMERPALKALLADIAQGKVDVVVVYKIDRLTRSLMDFSKIVEVFDQASVSFVSITQAFNTTTSMGRLTLNVLLSFAQFEREVTGERIRDKIAQSKAKGMWMGGAVLLGYDLNDRSLVINPVEADQVRSIYERYLKLGSVHRLRDQLEAEGVCSKRWISAAGKPLGGHVFSRGALYHLLKNRHYLGEIVHGDLIHPGLHPPIVDQSLFDRVQRKLKINAGKRQKRQAAPSDNASAHRLTGFVFDASGSPMSPTAAHGRQGRSYLYYVSAPLQTGRSGVSHKGPARLPGRALEAFVLETLQRLMQEPEADWPALAAALRRIDVLEASTELVLGVTALFGRRNSELALGALRRRLQGGEDAVMEGEDAVRILLPRRLQFRGGRRGVVKAQPRRADALRRDPTLVKALLNAHAILRRHNASPLQPAAALSHAASPDTAYLRRLSRLAFLAPELQAAILDGRQPQGLSVAVVMTAEIPIAWADQRRWWRALA